MGSIMWLPGLLLIVPGGAVAPAAWPLFPAAGCEVAAPDVGEQPAIITRNTNDITVVNPGFMYFSLQRVFLISDW
jgi:hypothetical protein